MMRNETVSNLASMLLGLICGAILAIYLAKMTSWMPVATNTDGTILEYNTQTGDYR